MKIFKFRGELMTALAVLFCVSLYAQGAQKRMALVIGVKNYQYVSPLQNTLNDARDMSAALKAKGFQVIESYDPQTKRQLQDAIIKYFQLLQSDKNSSGVLFYSGHGMQVDGSNYLIPAQANPQIKADLDDQCLNMDYVMRAIEQAGNPLNIFILDACRNNPFKGFYRSGEQGLNMVATPKGSYIVYATKPGSVASDGTGRNGLFTSKLLRYMNKEGLNIEQVFKQVAADVSTESGDAQRPWIASDYTGDFFFTPGAGAANTQPTTQPTVKTEPAYIAPVATALDYGYGTADARTVTVGTQEWLGKNLNVDHFANGEVIPEAKTDEDWKRAGENKQPAWCYYNNDPANGHSYGRLYNWYAVSDPRGLAPKGWHVPSDAEWTAITSYLGGEATAGTSLKSTYGWENTGNNNSGVAGLPGGYRKDDGTFYYIDNFGFWWSSTEGNTGSAWNRLLTNYNGVVGRSSYSKRNGYSVRCLRD